jgi:hypothetical protein
VSLGIRTRALALTAVAALAAITLTAGSFADASTPSITSDKADYQPGELVTLTGAGWQADESVHLNVNDMDGRTWQRDVDVVADGQGAFTDSFNLPDWFVATYSVTATGSSGAVATTSFTDANVNVTSPAPVGGVVRFPGSGSQAITAGGTHDFSATVNRTGGGINPVITGLQTQSGNPVCDDPATTIPLSWMSVPSTPISVGGPTNVTIRVAVPSGQAAGNYQGRFRFSMQPGTGNANDNLDVCVQVVTDTTPPVITKTISGTVGSNGWYRSNVTVTWTVTDPESAVVIDSGCGTQNFTSDTAGATSSCSAHSAGGSASDSVSFKIDKTAPVITDLGPTTSPNGNGWYKTDVVNRFQAADGLSGLDSACLAAYPASGSDRIQAKTTSGEGAAVTVVSDSCADEAGNSAAAKTSAAFKIDKTAPTASASAAPPANANGWNNSDVTVTFGGSDPGGSGIDFCDPAVVLSSEGAGQSASGDCTDKAGNVSATATASGIKIDKTAPVITDLGPTTSPNGNGWYKTDVVNRFQAADGLSGLDSACLAAYPASGSDRIQAKTTSGEGAAVTVVSDSCADEAGNSAAAKTSAAFKIDKTAPTIAGSAAPAPNAHGWNNTDVTVSYTCSDTLSGVDSCPSDDTLTSDGANQSASGTATDLAGNSASTTVAGIDIDKTAPTANASASPAPNANGWNNTDVTVTFTGSDALSGIDACDPAVVLSAEGANQSASGTCTDKAGNVSAPATASGIDIDKTKPTLVWNGGPADGSSHYFGFVPAAPTCAAQDALSGPDTCVVTGYGTTVGTHTMTATAKDKAGNSHSETRSYTVLAWTLTGFFQPVDMGGVFNTVKNGSTVPLKFRIFAGTTELTDTASVKSLTSALINCDATAPQDEVETTATGGTALRYDSTGAQFVYNWKTPSGAGKCHRVTMLAQDGSSLMAFFKLK